ncbi:hypothetical protein GCM10027346_30020 [Hymenobacter seoulensis]
MLGLTSLSALAQRASENHYLVTSKGDTLRGRISITGGQNQTIRLHRPNQSVADFSATDVTSYGDANGVWGVSQAVGRPQGEARFVTPLVLGPVSLFSGENTLGEKRFYIQPHDSAYIVEVPPATARLTYLRVLPGCPSLDFAYSQIEGRYLYNYNGLTRLVKEYNACRYPEQTAKQIAEPGGLQTYFGVKGGVHTTRLNYPGFPSSATYTAPFSYQGGVFMNVSSRKQFSLQIEAVYLAIRGEYAPINIYNGNASYTTTRAVSVKYSQLQFPLLLRYTIGHGSLRPYLNAGPVYGLNFNRKTEEILQDSDKPTATRRQFQVPSTNSVGGTAGLGLLVQRPSLPTFSLEARADHIIDSSGYYDTTPTHTSFRLDLGVAF